MTKLVQLIRDQRRRQDAREPVYIHCWQRTSDDCLGCEPSLGLLQDPREDDEAFFDRVAATAAHAGQRFVFIHFMRKRDEQAA
jgi:hypothetical protein